ncbi:hypothetical protein [Streptomyces sp. NBC_01439]|uniref:hypothetical protein n=1 Tax=Streptomyces sp. NBC_01439 TaxID=2903867 RepID=UPI002E2B3F17|nr:hypothetical protein [Streptomyces sp. NBC_01439]
MSIFVELLLAAVAKQVQPLPGVRGRRDRWKGAAGDDQRGWSGRILANSSEAGRPRETGRQWE